VTIPKIGHINIIDTNKYFVFWKILLKNWSIEFDNTFRSFN
jgi:hypothetical protein